MIDAGEVILKISLIPSLGRGRDFDMKMTGSYHSFLGLKKQFSYLLGFFDIKTPTVVAVIVRSIFLG